MSDFLFSKKNIPEGKLSKMIKDIYHADKPFVEEFSGEWGTVAVSQSLYTGFQPYESEEHLVIVLGGPVLCFQANTFLTGQDKNAGTRIIYNRWLKNELKYDKDLSGPFVLLIIDKISGKFLCITDMMAFIPVYIHEEEENLFIGSHLDALANASGQSREFDLISQLDFIINGVVTYPYTIYKKIRQLAPGTIYSLSKFQNLNLRVYWVPNEKEMFENIDDAASALRNGLESYVEAITRDMPNIGQFISGGEDSRVLAGLLADEKNREAFIFLDEMNREGKIAQKAAKAYNMNFNLGTRTKTHYIDLLEIGSDLVGSGSEFKHVHTYGFHKDFGLQNYPAVFGGLLSDSFLKGYQISKKFSTFYSFLPELKKRTTINTGILRESIVYSSIIDEINGRRQEHFNRVGAFRDKTKEEWFSLWPASMNSVTVNIYCNRRLFRTYEPFTSNVVLKISAGVSQEWKLNRRLFRRAAKPYLKKTKWLFHGDGRLPYFPWYINSLIAFPLVGSRILLNKLGFSNKNHGPWAEWNSVQKSTQWKERIDGFSEGYCEIAAAFKEKDVKKIFHDDRLSLNQKNNLLQVLYINKKQRQQKNETTAFMPEV